MPDIEQRGWIERHGILSLLVTVILAATVWVGNLYTRIRALEISVAVNAVQIQQVQDGMKSLERRMAYGGRAYGPIQPSDGSQHPR